MNFNMKKMDRLVFFALAFCMCLGLASCDDQWSRLKTHLLRKNREEVARQLVNDLVMNLLSQRFGSEVETENGMDKKSGWRSLGLPIQTRFAAFGSKLMPSREGGDHGSTLLRYGRSA